MLELPTTNYQLLTAYADEDNSSGGNNSDSESVTGGDVGAESISGSATDEQGNTTTFDNQGNITGESGPGGGPVSDGTTQGPGATGQGDATNGGGPPAGATAPNEALDAYTASDLAKAEANLSAALADMEQFGGLGATLFDQITTQAAVAEALANWDAAIAQYGVDMQTSYPSFSWDLATSLADFEAAINATAEINSRTEVAGRPNPAPAPPAAPAPVAAAPVAPPSVPQSAFSEGISISQKGGVRDLSSEGFPQYNTEYSVTSSRGYVGNVQVQTTYNPDRSVLATEVITNTPGNTGSYTITSSGITMTSAGISGGTLVEALQAAGIDPKSIK